MHSMPDHQIEKRRERKSNQGSALPTDQIDESYLTLRKAVMQNIISSKRDFNMANSGEQSPQILLTEEVNDITVNLLLTPLDTLEASLIKLSKYYFKASEEEGAIQSIDHSEICSKLHAIISLYKSQQSIIKYALFIFSTIAQQVDCDTKISLFLTNEAQVLNYLELIKACRSQSEELSLLISFFGQLIANSMEIQVLFIQLKIVDQVYDSFSIETNSDDEIDAKVYFFSLFDSGEIYKQHPDIAVKFEKTFRETTLYCASNNFDESLSTINNCLWGLSHITTSSDEQLIHQLLSTSLIEFFIDFKSQRPQFVVPTIRVIGNLLGTPDMSVMKKMIGFGCVEYITENIAMNCNINKEEALWALSNIIIDENLVAYVFEKKLHVFLLDLLESDNISNGCIKEIVSSLGGLITNMTSDQLHWIDNQRLCKAMVSKLQYSKSAEITYIILHFIYLLFKKDKEKLFITPFNHYGGGDLIERVSTLFSSEKVQIICDRLHPLLTAP